MEALIAILFGIFGGTMVERTHAYCDCFRDDFKGAYCESIKHGGEQGSCEIK